MNAAVNISSSSRPRSTLFLPYLPVVGIDSEEHRMVSRGCILIVVSKSIPVPGLSGTWILAKSYPI